MSDEFNYIVCCDHLPWWKINRKSLAGADLGLTIGVGRDADPPYGDTILSICLKNCMQLRKYWFVGWGGGFQMELQMELLTTSLFRKTNNSGKQRQEKYW